MSWKKKSSMKKSNANQGNGESAAAQQRPRYPGVQRIQRIANLIEKCYAVRDREEAGKNDNRCIYDRVKELYNILRPLKRLMKQLTKEQAGNTCWHAANQEILWLSKRIDAQRTWVSTCQKRMQWKHERCEQRRQRKSKSKRGKSKRGKSKRGKSKRGKSKNYLLKLKWKA